MAIYKGQLTKLSIVNQGKGKPYALWYQKLGGKGSNCEMPRGKKFKAAIALYDSELEISGCLSFKVGK